MPEETMTNSTSTSPTSTVTAPSAEEGGASTDLSGKNNPGVKAVDAPVNLGKTNPGDRGLDTPAGAADGVNQPPASQAATRAMVESVDGKSNPGPRSL